MRYFYGYLAIFGLVMGTVRLFTGDPDWGEPRDWFTLTLIFIALARIASLEHIINEVRTKD